MKLLRFPGGGVRARAAVNFADTYVRSLAKGHINLRDLKIVLDGMDDEGAALARAALRDRLEKYLASD